MMQFFHELEGAEIVWITSVFLISDKIRRKILVLGLLRRLRNRGTSQDKAVAILFRWKVDCDRLLASVTREAMTLSRAVPHLDSQCVVCLADVAGYVVTLNHVTTSRKNVDCASVRATLTHDPRSESRQLRAPAKHLKHIILGR